MHTPHAPHVSYYFIRWCNDGDVSSIPIRVFIVTGWCWYLHSVRTTSRKRAFFSHSPHPHPDDTTLSTGHPQLMSRKSYLNYDASIALATVYASFTFPTAICIPKMSSLSWRRSNAHSLFCIRFRLNAIAISLIVTSAPNVLQTRRKGKLPTVVRGARISLPDNILRVFAWF